MKKISKRQMYNIIIDIMKTGESPVPPEDIIAFAQHEIELIDEHNEKVKAYKKNKADNNAIVKSYVAECLTGEPEMIDVIVKRVEEVALSQYKITRSIVIYWLNQLVKEGKAAKAKCKNAIVYTKV